MIAVGAGICAGSAAAKWMLEVEPRPAGLSAGDPWHLQIRVVGSHFPRRHGVPVIRLRHVASGRALVQHAQPVSGQRRTYETTITFPEAGRWRYAVKHLGAVFRYRPVVIGERPPNQSSGDQSASLSTQAGADGTDSVPIVAGLGAGSLLLAAALAWRRKARHSSG